MKRPAGRPRVRVTPVQVLHLWSQGVSWRQIAKTLKIGTATAMRLFRLNAGGRPDIQRMRPETPEGIPPI